MIGTAERSVSISMMELSREMGNPPAMQRSPTPDASDRTYPMHPAGAQEKHQWSAQHIISVKSRKVPPIRSFSTQEQGNAKLRHAMQVCG